MLTPGDVQSVAPALDRYTRGSLLGELWKRPQLDNGVKPDGPTARDFLTLLPRFHHNVPIEQLELKQ